MLIPFSLAIAEQAPTDQSTRQQWQQLAGIGVHDNHWLKTFKDPVLDQLLDEALADTQSTADAAVRIGLASSLSKKALGNLVPATTGLLSGSDASHEPIAGVTAGASLNTYWERQFWFGIGTKSRPTPRSEADATTRLQFARLSLLGQVAKTWFLAAEARLQHQLATEAVDVYTDLYDLTGKLHDDGRIGAATVNMARRDLAEARVRLRHADGAYDQGMRSLEKLLGRIPLPELEAETILQPALADLPTVIPGDFIAQRPDLAGKKQNDPAVLQVLEAFGRTMSAELLLAERQSALEATVATNARALKFAVSSESSGNMNRIGLLQVKAHNISGRMALARVRYARASRQVDLYLAQAMLCE